MVRCTTWVGVPDSPDEKQRHGKFLRSSFGARRHDGRRVGTGDALELGALAGKPLLLILQIEEVVEQESLHVSIWGSADGQNWGTQALFWFPQKFYSGVTPAALDLAQRPGHQISSSPLGSEPVGTRHSAPPL